MPLLQGIIGINHAQAQRIEVDLAELFDGPVAAGANTTYPPPLTLQQAIDAAVRTNHAFAAREANYEASKQNVVIARAQGLPTISLVADVRNDLQRSTPDPFSPTRQVVGSLEATQPLYSGGAVRHGQAAARYRAESSARAVEGARLDLTLAVASAYANVVRDRAVVRILNDSQQKLSTILAATRARFAAQDVTRTDVRQVETRLAFAEGDLAAARASLAVSNERFRQLVGAPAGRVESYPVLRALPVDLPSTESAAIERSPALRSVRALSDAAEADVGSARAAQRPRVSLGVSTTFASTLGSLANTPVGNLDRSIFGSTVFARLSVPLFNGGATTAATERARAVARAAKDNLTEAERAVRADVRAAYARAQMALTSARSAAAAAKASRESLNGVREENAIGTRSVLDILNAEQELSLAELRIASAERDLFVEQATLLTQLAETITE